MRATGVFESFMAEPVILIPMPQPAVEMYAELHAWSNFSFLQGGSHPEELVERAAAARIGGDCADRSRRALRSRALFDARARRGVAAIIGSELTFEDGAHIVLLVENECGYANLCRLISTRADAREQGRRAFADWTISKSTTKD